MWQFYVSEGELSIHIVHFIPYYQCGIITQSTATVCLKKVNPLAVDLRA